MPPIRKGDGTPVTPKGISQIRTGDGRILFDGVAIPDSVVAHYDAQAETTTGPISSITDRSNSFDLSGSCVVISDGINGYQSYRFDGSETMSNSSLQALTEPFGIVAVVQQQAGAESNDFYFDSDGNVQDFAVQDDNNEEFHFYRDTDQQQAIGGTVSTNPEVMVATAPASGDVFLELSGTTQIDDSTGGTTGFDGFTMAGRADDELPLEVDYGEVTILNDFASQDVEDEKQRMADKWDITLS